MSEGVVAHRVQAPGQPLWEPEAPSASSPSGSTEPIGSTSPSWRLRNGLPPHLLQWAFAPGTDRLEAKSVMEFVTRLLENPDVGEAVVSPASAQVGPEDAPEVKHAVPPGTSTRVVWRFYRPLRWIEILALGTA